MRVNSVVPGYSRRGGPNWLICRKTTPRPKRPRPARNVSRKRTARLREAVER